VTNSDQEGASWPKILVVDDDESELLALKVGLEREQMSVTGLTSGAEALALHDALAPDLVVLDVVLRDTSGIELCRELRARGVDTPVIMVSARSEEMDVVVGIEVGADDYVTKPYRMRELVARIGALLRRRRAVLGNERTPSERGGRTLAGGSAARVLAVGGVVLDEDRHEVRVRNRRVDLSLREHEVLRELLANAGRVVTRDELLARVWGLDYEGDPRIVSTLVGRIRARLGLVEPPGARIVTIRGVGYRLDAS
jgi:two-component system response regulator RegX3